MINYLETFINETQVFKSLDSPDHYWLAACSPDWLWSLGSYTWFHSLANWRPPPEMGQKIKRASFWRVLTLNVSLQPARMRMLWHLKQLGSQSWCVCVCVCVCVCSSPVPSSLWAPVAEVASSLVSPAVSPPPSHSWISSVLKRRSKDNRNNRNTQPH